MKKIIRAVRPHRLLRFATVLAILSTAAPEAFAGQDVRDGTGIADGFGYRVFDHHDPECSFAFVDIEGGGTPVAFSASGVAPADDDGGAVIDLAAPFELYGVPVATVVMSSNGYLSSASTLAVESGGDFSNDPVLPAIPDNAPGTPWRLMPYHDELNGLDTGGIAYHQHLAPCSRPSEALPGEACTVFLWKDWGLPGGDAMDFQAIVYHQSFEIVFQIHPGASVPGGGTIGIQNSSASVASQYRRDAALAADTAVCIFEPRFPPGGPLADLEITKSDKLELEIEVPAASIGYSIGVRNHGPSPVSAAQVTDLVPATLSGCSWTCEASRTKFRQPRC